MVVQYTAQNKRRCWLVEPQTKSEVVLQNRHKPATTDLRSNSINQSGPPEGTAGMRPQKEGRKMRPQKWSRKMRPQIGAAESRLP